MGPNRLGLWRAPTTVHPLQLHKLLPPGYIYYLIPRPTLKTPGQLLKDYYSGRPDDPALADTPSIREGRCCYPDGLLDLIDSLSLVGKWERPNGLDAEPVPVRVALPEPQVVVEFRNSNLDSRSTGVAMMSLYQRHVDHMEGAGDIIFNGFGGMELDFVIAWPGYPIQRSTIRTVEYDGRPLTRFDLGREITTMYAKLFMTVEEEKTLPAERGFYSIALHQGRRARRDSSGVQLTQLYLVRLRGTVDGDWVADVDIV